MLNNYGKNVQMTRCEVETRCETCYLEGQRRSFYSEEFATE